MDENNNSEISVSTLSDSIIQVLKEEAVGGPMLLSKLGLRLSSKLGTPLRAVLGTRKLRDVVEASLGDIAKFEGQGTALAVSLAAEPGGQRAFRFDPVFWAAFARPLAEGKHRLLKITRPFHFRDVDTLEVAAGWVEIGRELVPDGSILRPERDAIVLKSIQHWCSENDQASSQFLYRPPAQLPKQSPGFAHSTAPEKGVEALKKFIEAIPSEERSKYSLPLDLLTRLLS